MATCNLEYIFTFSSFYKAMYAQEKLQDYGIYSDLRRLPPELIRSCGQGLYIWGNDLQESIAIFAENRIETKGIFQLTFSEGKKKYNRIK